MRTRHRTLLALLAVATTSATAAAQPLRTRATIAAPVHLVSLRLVANQPVTFTTDGSAPGVDPVLRVLGPDGVELGHDDNSGGGRDARLTVAAPRTGTYLLMVHARSSAASGTTSIRQDGRLLATTAVGGAVVAVPPGDLEVETAFVPGGLNDPTLFALGPDDRVVGFDTNGGVGLGARLPQARGRAAVLVATALGDLGDVDVYFNDRGDDRDGDGLGRRLELELGTCDDTTTAACAGVANPRDTDHDGLDDGAEVFGIDDVRLPQLLPRWGADPRHKDLFVEVDFPPTEARLSMGPAEAAAVQAYYAAGPAADLANPDGRPGVSLHLDLGQAPADPVHETLFGAWGGAGRGSSTEYATSADDPRSFAAIRRGVFRYALVSRAAGGGQSDGWRFGAGNDAAAFAHELGHSVGLIHSGHPSWGLLNCNPVYTSLMSYAGGAGFSLGTNGRVNPSKADEFAARSWTSALSASRAAPPWSFVVAAGQIDWNRDGVFGTTTAGGDGRVRAGVNWATFSECATTVHNAQPLATDATPEVTPRLARLGAWMYALYVVSGGIQVRWARVGGPDSDGSCPGGSRLGATCMAWSAPAPVPTSAWVDRFAAVADDTGLVVAYSSRGTIRSFRIKPTATTGALGGASAEELVVARGAFEELDLAMVPSPPDVRGVVTRRVALFYTDGVYRWTDSKEGLGPWTDHGPVRLVSGAGVRGKYGVAAAPVPGARLADGTPATTCLVMAGVATELPAPPSTLATPQQLGLYCLAPDHERWLDYSATMFPGSIVTHGRPGLAFHLARRADGQPATSPPRGQLVVTFSTTAPVDTRYLGLVGFSTPIVLGQPIPSALGLVAFGNHRDQWSYVPEAAGFALYEDPQLSALKAARSFRIASTGRWTLEFLPFFDGTVDAELADGNDFRVMESGICRGLRGDTFCGGPNQWGY